MRRNLLLFLLILSALAGKAQEDFHPSGKPFATIFANFHSGFVGTAVDEAAFELVRGYIGYEYTFSPEFYAKNARLSLMILICCCMSSSYPIDTRVSRAGRGRLPRHIPPEHYLERE